MVVASNRHEMSKKLRERSLIEEFLVKCPDYRGALFDSYGENPDLIYKLEGKKIGFDSIIIAKDQNAIECHFDQKKCQFSTPQTPDNFKFLVDDLLRMLLKHIRKYTIPTVLVFSVFDDRVDLNKLASSFRLPEFDNLNIEDYYLSNKEGFVKVSENELSRG